MTEVRIPKIIGPVLVFVGAISLEIMAILDFKDVFFYFGHLRVLSVFFCGIIPILISYLAMRAFLLGSRPPIFLLGCGLLSWGVFGVFAGALFSCTDAANRAVTVYDTGALVSSVLHLAGAVGLVSGWTWSVSKEKRRIFVYAACFIITALAAIFAYAVAHDWIWPFLSAGTGPTLLRQVVLAHAVAFYAVSGIILMTYYFWFKSDFLYWYSLALLMMTIALIGILFVKAIGTPINWYGKSALFISTIFAMFAAYSALRNAKVKGISLETAIETFFENAETRYKTLVDTAGDSIITFNNDENIIGWNPAARRMFGYSDQEVFGRNFFGLLIPPEFVGLVRHEMPALSTSKRTPAALEKIELEAVRRDGGRLPVELSVSIYKRNLGWTTTCIIRDITERKKIEKALRESEDRFRKLFEDIPNIPVQGYDELRKVIFWNSASERLYGYSKEEAIGKQLEELIIPPEMRKRVIEDIDNWVTRSKRIPSGELGLMHKDGSTVPVYSSHVMIENIYGNKEMFCIDIDLLKLKQTEEKVRALNRTLEQKVARRTLELAGLNATLEKEIDGHKRTELALTESEERFRLIFQNSLDAVLLVRPSDGKVMAANHAACSMLGYTESEMYDLDRSSVTDESDPAWMAMIEERSRTGKARAEINYRRKNGEIFPAEMAGAIFRTGSGEDAYVILIRDITERKSAEERLCESEAQLKEAQSLAKVGSWSWNIRSNTVTWSEELYRIMGLYPEIPPTARREYSNLFMPESWALWRTTIKKALENGNPFSLELQTRHSHDGQRRWVIAHGRAEKDKAGIVLRLHGTVQDITERKKAEEERLAAAAEIEDLYDKAPCGYHSIDGQGLFVSINHTESAWLGYTQEEIIGKKTIREVLTEESFKTFQMAFPLFKERGLLKDLELDMVRKDGTILPVLVNATAVSDSTGKFLRSRTSVFDITDRRVALEKLKESEERYQRAFHESPAVRLITDPDTGEISDANQAAAGFYGYELDRLKELKISDINVDPSGISFEEMERSALESRKSFVFKHRQASGGIRDVEIYSSPIETNGKLLLSSIIHDVSERIRMQDLLKHRAEELAAMNEELIRSNEDLEHFAYIASHDLQEPLRNVANALQMLEKLHKHKLGKESDELINYAVDSSKRMKSLITDLLTYSRLVTHTQPFGAVNVQDVLETAIKNLSSSIQLSRAEITYDEMPIVRGDASQLVQVFQNLIGNALKFGPSEYPQVHISASRQESEWVFSVSDNGIGIEKEYFDRIFIIFQQLNRKGLFEGTGMGLAIVKKIVERHKGRVWVKSEVGVGSTFCFTLPDISERNGNRS